jgi:lipid A disaccharide synthetase
VSESQADQRISPGQIIVTVNGPGEISSWLLPLARMLKKEYPELHISAALLPSVFRAGTELGVLRSLKEVDAAASITQSRSLIFFGRTPPGFLRNKKIPGCVLHMGGEPLMSRILAWRMGYPLYFYGEERPKSRRGFSHIFLSGSFIRPKGKSIKAKGGSPVTMVGNLMVDAVINRPGRGEKGESSSLTVGLFPGSRIFQAEHMLPFFIRVAGLISRQNSPIRWMFAKSDYISLETIDGIISENRGRIIEGENAKLVAELSPPCLVSQSGVSIEVESTDRVLSRADAALCIPGTNTAELGALGIPMIVMLPTQKPWLYPMPGLAGHLHRLPLFGKSLKTGLLYLFWKRIKYFAYPNRIAGRLIVPEIVDKITPEQIARALTELLDGGLTEISKNLRHVMGESGASRRLGGAILNLLGLDYKTEKKT